VNSPDTDGQVEISLASEPWRYQWPGGNARAAQRSESSRKSLAIAIGLFFLTLFTALIAGAQFAAAYAHNQSFSFDAFVQMFRIVYRHPAALLSGFPFALTLLTILLAHELGHYYACRHHHIRSTYPFFIPGPTLIGTFGAFILIRSPIRSARALFDVGASGPFVGFVVAMPALLYGVLHAKVIPSFASDSGSEVIFGTPLILRLVAAIVHPNANVDDLLLHPVARAAWVGLFATALNLLPVGQLDGGHIVRSISPRAHRIISLLLPIALIPLAIWQWPGWYFWAALLFGLRFFSAAPIYDPTPLDPNRRFGVAIALIVFILCFMPKPL
jgi:membrane-associated protease RseP (regulator of RpoE activity)